MPHRPAEEETRLRHLAELLPAFEEPGFEPCVWHRTEGQMPYPVYAPVVDRLVELFYDDGWLASDFDWMAWTETDEARRLATDPEAMQRATAEQLGRVLTVLVRRERFGDGMLGGAVASGLVAGALRRAAELVAFTDGVTAVGGDR
ncbi:MAG: DUF6508 domain-containing protein [Trueperaceae bacterium]